MENLFNGIYKGRKVLVTGHTGFKGSWLMYWLSKMGAEVTGFALRPPTNPSHFEALHMRDNSIIGNILDAACLADTIKNVRPEIVFHLAAQPLVRDSYTDPVGTYAVNVMGTMNVCEACRACDSVQAIVSITTDKVYHNREWCWGYREDDRLGGYDPYSSSKACAEIMLASYRNSFFNVKEFGKSHNVLLSSVRAGNVIGGGDWAKDRLIPDIMQACGRNEKVVIRNPHATRPWQHVLECLSGYLMVGQQLLRKNSDFASSFNFGPPEEGALSVEDVVRSAKKYWPTISYEIVQSKANPHEAHYLSLDCAKARTMLNWRPVWNINTTFEKTVGWYRKFSEEGVVSTSADVESFVMDAVAKELPWTK